MKGEARISLSVALACAVLFYPHFAHAAAAKAVSASSSATQRAVQVSAKKEALKMVPADANLIKGIDARKIHAGDQFRATLQRTVHLKNGPELKSGTVLLGTVTADQTKPGDARLALRFTRAELKDGKVIPIKATVMEIAPPTDGFGENLADETSDWNGHTLNVDELGAFSGVDMHSSIASRNSAVFVSKKNDDVKLDAGTQISLAIAERGSQRASTKGGA